MSHLMVNFNTLLIILAFATFISLPFKRPLRWGVVTGLLILSVSIPVAGSNPWLWINGAVGELSILTVVLLTLFILRKLADMHLVECRTRVHLYFLVLLMGFLLYPATLGLSQFDPYALGYGVQLSLLVLSLATLYWVFQQRQVAVLLIIVVAASEIGLLTSLNSWDYLIDPLLWLFTPAILIIMYFNGRGQAKRSA